MKNLKKILVAVAIIVATYVLYMQITKSNTSDQSQETENFSAQKPVMKLYYAEWCGWSKKFLPTWDELAKNIKTVDFVKIDCVKMKDQCENIPGFPHIVLESNNKKIPYSGDRSYGDCENFINTNK